MMKDLMFKCNSYTYSVSTNISQNLDTITLDQIAHKLWLVGGMIMLLEKKDATKHSKKVIKRKII